MNETSPLTVVHPTVEFPMESTQELAPAVAEPAHVEGEGLLRTGTSLKEYRLVSRLATGATTEVWLAMLTGAQGFEKGVALKAMLPDPARRPALIDVLTTEASIGGRLYHPSIVQILDFTQDAGRYFISMEYVGGLTLGQARRRLARRGTRFPIPLLVHVVGQICQGLHYAHELVDGDGRLDFIHRNITPENVILSRSGAVKLIDFGAARVRSIPGSLGTAGVELPYAAPERLKNQIEDRRVDLYSLGVTMYELLCGRRPFAGEEKELRSRILEGRAPAPRELVADLPEGIARVVQGAMAVSPDDRPTSAQQLASDLQSAYETHLSGLPNAVSDRFDLRDILTQVFRDVPTFPGEGRVPFPVRLTEIHTHPPTPVPIPISRDRNMRVSAPELATVTDDVTEPCAMTLEGVALPTAPMGVTPPDGSPTPAPATSLPSLSWLFDRREDERRTSWEVFQAREGSEAAAPVGSVFDHTSRSHVEQATPSRDAAAVDVPVSRAENSTPDIFASRRAESRGLPLIERRAPKILEAVECFDRGLTFLADKQYQLALCEWERALELDPNNRMYQTNVKRLRARL